MWRSFAGLSDGVFWYFGILLYRVYVRGVEQRVFLGQFVCQLALLTGLLVRFVTWNSSLYTVILSDLCL